MDALRVETMSLNPKSEAAKSRAKAEQTANQFEAVFVKTFVSAMRETAALGGDEGGMFGSGPGADTYASWFDDNVSSELARTGGIGIAKALMTEMERDHKIATDKDAYGDEKKAQAQRIQRIANGRDLHMAKATGGLNELL